MMDCVPYFAFAQRFYCQARVAYVVLYQKNIDRLALGLFAHVVIPFLFAGCKSCLYRKSKRRALAECAFHPDSPSVALHNALAECKTNSAARIFLLSMQPLKNDEKAVEVLRIDPDAVVLDRDYPLTTCPVRSDMYARRFISFSKFDPIPD
jgi:hypothetical protein